MVSTERQRRAVTPSMTAPAANPWAQPVVGEGTSASLSLPYGVEFQGMLLRVLLDDPFFARSISKHIAPHFFQNEALSWAWASAQRYHTEHQRLPSFAWIVDAVRQLDAGKQQLFYTVLESARYRPLTDEEWLRSKTVDFVKRCVFRQAFQDSRDLFAGNKYDAAYDLMQERMDVIRTVSFDTVDRGWYAEEFTDRMIARQNIAAKGGSNLIPTGLPGLDKLFGGGAYESFLGIWIAYPKAGKTTMLTNLGAIAMRTGWKRVLHVVLEGSRKMVEARYDAFFSDELYASVRTGDVDGKKYAAAVAEMNYMRGLLVIRGFTDRWDANIIDVDAEMMDLRRSYGWDPDLVIIDYGDLLQPRTQQANETLNQISAFKDMKALANRGKVVWTASQAQRPRNEDFDTNPTVLRSRDIADAYGKVRIADFVGSINSTQQERQFGVDAMGPSIRIFAELFREGAAHTLFRVPARFDRMTIEMMKGVEVAYDEKAMTDPLLLANKIEAELTLQKKVAAMTGIFHVPKGPPLPYQQVQGAR